MNNINHVIYCPFTGLGEANGFRGDEWYQHRSGIFNKFTLKSLEGQKKEFILWASFRPQEEDNPITEKIEQYIKDARLNYVLTFDGLMFHDDRNVEINETLKQRLEISLKKVEKKIDRKRKYVYLTILASDDMLASNFTEIAQSKEYINNGAWYQRKGYVYNSETKELADWYNPESVGSYTILYETDEFLDVYKHLLKQKNLTSHELIPQIYTAEEMPPNLYCAVVHGKNISTIWDHPFKKKPYCSEEDKNKILKTFNI